MMAGNSNDKEEEMYKELFEGMISRAISIENPYVFTGTTVGTYAFYGCNALDLSVVDFSNVTDIKAYAFGAGPTGVVRCPNAIRLAGGAFRLSTAREIYLDSWNEEMSNTFFGASNCTKLYCPNWNKNYFGSSINGMPACEYFFGNSDVDTLLNSMKSNANINKGSVFHFGTTGYKIVYDTNQAAWVKVAESTT
jgi:hypothetical protein